MSDKPILFSAPMVKALLAGRKTQTRRAMTRNNSTVLGERWGRKATWEGLRFAEAIVRNKNPLTGVGDPHLAVPFCHPNDEPTDTEDCGIYRVRPEIEIGDRLWVREAWKPHSLYDAMQPRDMPKTNVFYMADDRYSPSGSRGRPGIHMPRWASRLTLIVTDVRVQRLNEISEEDAIAEGARQEFRTVVMRPDGGPDYHIPNSHRGGFANLWCRINGSGAWEANPWVCAISFEVHKANIDALEPALAEPAP